ncbi:hypothetical protein EV385_2620 [Krasilnikovia cinnamomea]|uniref:Amidase n=2 Tax=Krasilnikovia cinnamomea TaxID=349313 RepID=A0A4Q7ZJY5_9ACTN|nr:hypothetical protein EV385_2620 [Krasilnikovia cinnamomea]
MWLMSALSVVVLTASGANASAGTAPAPPGTRAMWLWSQADPAEVMSWAARHDVTEIFTYVGTTVATDGSLPRLRELKRQADLAGVRLSALGGDESWTTDHAAALAWQKAVTGTKLFAGLHVDAEPYLLPAWNTNRNATATAYLTLLQRLRDAGPLAVEVDVPFWYGTITVSGKNLATETLRRASAVTVMSYRDSGTGPNSIYDVSRDWLARGAAAGKRVRLGAETRPLSDCPYCTFAEEGATALGDALARVDGATRSAPAFNGIAVHDYDGWRALPS